MSLIVSIKTREISSNSGAFSKSLFEIPVKSVINGGIYVSDLINESNELST